MRFEPHPYQKEVINRIVSQKRIALLLDMGTGKTACTLSALRWLMNGTMEFDKALVVAPLSVAESTWPEQIEQWDQFRGMRISRVLGTQEQRIRGLGADADIYVINRENLAWLFDHFRSNGLDWPFGALVIDESSSFKNRASKRWKAAKSMAMATPRVILLTGTPAPNGLMDLWAQIYLLDGGKALGQSIGEYRSRYFHPGAHKGWVVFEYIANRGSEERIYKAIEPLAISLKVTDEEVAKTIKMPERIDEERSIKLSKEVARKCSQMEEDYLATISGTTITAATAGVVENKLLQIADGMVYDESGRPVWIHDDKIRMAERIADENDGKPIVVFYNYRFDEARLLGAFKGRKVRILDGPETKKEWNGGRIDVLLVNPASNAYGLNLQDGGHLAVWLTPIWNLELWQQANARLWRQGQKQAVVVYRIVAEGTEDERVYKALEGKAATQNDLIRAVKMRIKEAAGHGG